VGKKSAPDRKKNSSKQLKEEQKKGNMLKLTVLTFSVHIAESWNNLSGF